MTDPIIIGELIKISFNSFSGEGITGPLTQRLVSALVEEDVISNDGKNTITNDSNDSGGENNSLSANRASLLSLTSAMKNGVDVERSVKKELIDLGILDVNDFPKVLICI